MSRAPTGFAAGLPISQTEAPPSQGSPPFVTSQPFQVIMPGLSGRQGWQEYRVGGSGVSGVASGPREQSLASVWCDSDERSSGGGWPPSSGRSAVAESQGQAGVGLVRDAFPSCLLS